MGAEKERTAADVGQSGGDRAKTGAVALPRMEWRSASPLVPHPADAAWTTDRSLAEDEVEAFHALGRTDYELQSREVTDA